jgi:putative heme-binding domain-containing protein
MRFTDTNNDGVADEREVILSGWVLNHNAATLSGPFFGPDGWLYMCDARRGFDITTKEGTQLKGKGARIWRCRPDGTGLQSVSGGGFDNTIELVFMPSGETIGTMTYFTDPKDGFRDALMHWVEGGVYPKPQAVIEADQLKLTGDLMPVMTKLARVSHAGLMRYNSPTFGSQFQGNLFSAQFNTGRVMRHIITPEGATYKTVDEPFMESTSSDSHPTDVLQDADGSLLVVNTGGWFIAGCPLSVVAKKDVYGGIYRIRKVGAPEVKDPWGRQLNLTAMQPNEITPYLSDPRPAVRANAMEQLIMIGKGAVEPLKEIISSSENEELRASAVFALYRINTPSSMKGVLKAFDDNHVIVRTAAARVVGLAKEREALEQLMEIVENDKAPVRRQAATALGQIGDSRAVSALLNASADIDDRFVEHAIIYSLITLGKTAPLVDALDHPSGKVRKTALVALDQMDNSPLSKSDLVPFLASEDPQLQNTGIWVASHHPEWADIVIDFLNTRLTAAELSETDKKTFTDLMLTFCGDAKLQDFISSQLTNAGTPLNRKLMLLDVIDRCSVKELPDVWVNLMENLLEGDNVKIFSEVLDLLESRKIPALDKKLQQIIQNPTVSAAFQIKALGARLMSAPQLSDVEFRMLLKHLDPSNEPQTQRAAVRLLVQAELNETQLLQLAREQVAQADIFLLPGLINAFEGNLSKDIGEAVIVSLQSSTDRLENLSVQDLQNLFKSFPTSVREAGQPLITILKEQQANRLAQLQELEAALEGGDVGEGRELFFGKGICSSCHSVEGNGGDFGPDLTNIGEIRSQHDILEATVFPSASFAREYETSKIITTTKTYTGIIKEELPESLVVETGPGIKVRISRAEITAIESHNTSLMPQGLDKILTTEEMADLMAYLRSLPDGLAHVKKKTHL